MTEEDSGLASVSLMSVMGNMGEAVSDFSPEWLLRFFSHPRWLLQSLGSL